VYVELEDTDDHFEELKAVRKFIIDWAEGDASWTMEMQEGFDGFEALHA
jgi:hypothetical protein